MTVRRIALGLLTAVATALAAFAAVRMLPGDPAETALFQQGLAPTADALAVFRAEHGLDAPLWRQFLQWAWRLATGDWGRSLRTGEPVLGGLMRRLPVSLAIGAGGLATGATAAYGLALLAAAGSRTAGRLTRMMAVLAQAVPAFVCGIGILYVFGVELRWLKPFTGGPVERVLLPALVVALYSCGSLARLVVLRLAEAMAMPWFTTARAKGCSPFAAVRGHAGGFGLIALTAALRPEAAWVVGGTAVTEVLFGAPGISAWVVESITHRDLAVLQGYILVVALWMLAVHSVSDTMLRVLDPRLAS